MLMLVAWSWTGFTGLVIGNIIVNNSKVYLFVVKNPIIVFVVFTSLVCRDLTSVTCMSIRFGVSRLETASKTNIF